MTGFFDVHPEHKECLTDAQQESRALAEEREQRLDDLMAATLTGECTACGSLSDNVMFGRCNVCDEV